jgi:hypothetical protein
MTIIVTMEQWKTISGYENFEICDTGNVRHKKSGNIVPLHHTLAGNQYEQVLLPFENAFHYATVHRLVAMQHIQNDRVGIANIVDHIDKNKRNNNVTNLRWVTRSENARNCCISKSNKSGHTGVGKRKNYFYCSITIGGKQQRTYFHNKRAAIRERRRLEKLHSYGTETKWEKRCREINAMIELNNHMNHESDVLTKAWNKKAKTRTLLGNRTP